MCVFFGPGVGGMWLHMHVGVHTRVCTLCYQLKVRNVSEVPMFTLSPEKDISVSRETVEGEPAIHLYPTIDSSDGNLKIILVYCILFCLNL